MAEEKKQSMRTIVIDKISLNIGAGKDPRRLEKSELLIKHITGIQPVKTITFKRIAQWGLRPGLPIGCMLTLRGDSHRKLLSRLLMALDNKLSAQQFDSEGNISFGIKEYIDIPDVKYNPEIGIMGLQVTVRLKRPGFRISTRRVKARRIPRKHRIAQQESIDFMKKNFNVIVEDE